jgi:HlyD family secretion protein
LIVLVSIPVAIMTSLAVLGAMGESVNIMTLGGFALAVGILVDDVTVAIDGVVTARDIDGGDLVTMDSASAQPPLTIQNDTVLRVVVDVPQAGAVGVRRGLAAVVTIAEMPGKRFAGLVSRTAVALDPASRTLRVESDVDNRAHEIDPGLYVNVAFAIPRDTPGLLVPSEALVFDAQGMQVAVVKNDRVQMRNVTIYRDLGTSVELRSGVESGDEVALEPPVQLSDGDRVHIDRRKGS